MQGRGTIIGLTLIVAVISILELRYTFLANQVEDQARAYAEAKHGVDFEDANSATRTLIESAEAAYLDSIQRSGEEFGPLNDNYTQIKNKEINLGLDLQGGLSVTLEIPVDRILNSLANKNRDAQLKEAIENAKAMQSSSSADFITLFTESWNEVAGERLLAELFINKNNSGTINATTTNEQLISYLRTEVESVIANTEQILRTRIDGLGLKSPNITRAANSERITVELAGAKNPDEIKRWITSSARLEFWDTYNISEVISALDKGGKALYDKQNAGKKDKKVEEPTALPEPVATNEKVEEKKDEELDLNNLDAATANIQKDSTSGINPNETAEVENAIFALVAQGTQNDGALIARFRKRDTAKVSKYLASEEVRKHLKKNVEFLWGSTAIDRDNSGLIDLYAIKGRKTGPKLDGNSITKSVLDYNQMTGEPTVDMTMNEYGRNIWKKMTTEAANNGNKSIAIVLDQKVISAPSVNESIAGGRSSISGNFTTQSAKNLANILSSGKLQVKPVIVEESVVGPTLGEESKNTSFRALMAGLLIVLLFMIIYYHKAGAVADLSLFINLFFIIGILAGYGATLTLPGMAGLVLTIGMSVDANVIIFERIREEIRRGLDFKAAIASGFKHSYSAIIDANITTLLTGAVLAYFGSGPVKGFATVLIIGILTSFFTAVLVSRVILQRSIDKNKEIKFETNISKGILANANFDFIKNRKKAYLISGIVIALGIASMVTRGFEMGVEFDGGKEIVVEFNEEVSTTTENITEAFKANEAFAKADVVVKTYGTTNSVQITSNYLKDVTVEAEIKKKNAALSNVLDTYAGGSDKYRIIQARETGASIADDFQRTSRNSTIIGIIVVFIYIFVRFSRIQFGLGAIVAIFHDVLITLSMFSIFKGLLPFDLEISQAFVAALLTVIGYSINDTVVIFDRIREYFNKGTSESAPAIINRAVNNTLSRTVMTTMTTFIVVAILLIFGSSEIQGFAFALLIGIISGTYSSIFIATPAIIDLDFSNKLEEGMKEDAERRAAEIAIQNEVKAQG